MYFCCYQKQFTKHRLNRSGFLTAEAHMAPKFWKIVKAVYKGNTCELENVALMSSIYTGQNYMHYSLMGKWDCPLLTVICYIQVPFKAGLTNRILLFSNWPDSNILRFSKVYIISLIVTITVLKDFL